MKKKFLYGVLVIFSLIFSLKFTTNTVSAHSFYWWEKPRKVIVINDHTIYQIKKRYPLYRSYRVKKKTLHPGDVVTIHHAASYTWIVNHSGWANGYGNNRSSKFWETGGKNWYELYNQKYFYWDKGSFYKNPKETGITVRINRKQEIYFLKHDKLPKGTHYKVMKD